MNLRRMRHEALQFHCITFVRPKRCAMPPAMKTLTILLTVIGFVGVVSAADVPVLTDSSAAPRAVVGTGANEAPPASVQLPPNVLEIIRLAESRIERPVILAYIEAARTPFLLAADEIIYLKDIGIDADVVTAMLNRDSVLRAEKLQLDAAAATESAAAPQPVATNSATPVYVTNAPTQVTYFYNALEPYGTWIDVEGLGWCWQPSVAVIDRGWRPYWQGGGWVYTDCGWYWRSDYSWGWAPFHYGRWQLHARCGWVWLPDLVWAPAWVSWRYSDAYCGWAPLPPSAHFVVGSGFVVGGVSVGVGFDFGLGVDLFTFVDLGHFNHHHPYLYSVPRANVVNVYRNTTVVNNYLVRNGVVHDRSVDVGRVATATRQEIRPVTVREAPAGSMADGRPERFDRAGATLYRPQLAKPASPSRIAAQRIDEHHPVVRPTPRLPAIVPSAREGRSTVARSAPALPRAPESLPQKPRPAIPQSSPSSREVPRQNTPGANPSAPRHESPRGREQRLSNGDGMHRVIPQPPVRQPSASGGHARPPQQMERRGRP